MLSFNITNTLFTAWIVMGLLLIICFIAYASARWCRAASTTSSRRSSS